MNFCRLTIQEPIFSVSNTEFEGVDDGHGHGDHTFSVKQAQPSHRGRTEIPILECGIRHYSTTSWTYAHSHTRRKQPRCVGVGLKTVSFGQRPRPLHNRQHTRTGAYYINLMAISPPKPPGVSYRTRTEAKPPPESRRGLKYPAVM
jgi:hypothetical protein